jgi:hypothetical protein
MPITLTLPEPPSLNKMLSLAMQRTRRTRNGGWTTRVVPGIVYDQHHEAYVLRCTAALRQAKIVVPQTSWQRWEMTAAHFRLHNLRDPFELLAGLKWVVDWLVFVGFAANDSPREVRSIPTPTQEICRTNRGVTITIVPLPNVPKQNVGSSL